VVSQLLDQIVIKQPAPPQQDPVKFFYFSKMNLALKISNLQSKDVLTLELKLILNQIHE
jgi:hypothetical protein